MAQYVLTRGTDTSHADAIDLNDGNLFILADSLDLSEVGRIRFTLFVNGASVADRVTRAESVFRLISAATQAESIGSSVTFAAQHATGAGIVYYLLTGSATDPRLSMRVQQGGFQAEYDLDLTAYPYPITASVPVTVAGTLAGSTAAFLVEDVPGTEDALAHLEFTDTGAGNFINAVRVATIRDADFTAATDYTAWVDAVAMAGATDTADATALGGEYATRTLTSTTYVDIARAVMPAGNRQRGRMDGYARVYSDGDTIDAPTSFISTEDTAITTTAVTQPASTAIDTIEVVQSIVSRVTAGTSIAETWPATTTDGNLLVLIVLQQQTDAPTTPSGWTPATAINGGVAGTNVSMSVYYKKNAAAESSTVTVSGLATATVSDPATICLLELSGAYAGASNVVIGNVTTDVSVATTAFVINAADTAFDGQATLAIVGLGYNSTTSQLAYWGGGFQEVVDDYAVLVGMQPAASMGSTPAPVANLENARGGVAVALGIRPSTTAIAEVSETTYEEPTPGELAVGTYTARVQAIDASGYRSDATSTDTEAISTARSAMVYNWVASTGAVAYVVTISFAGRFYEAITTETTYTLTTLSGLAEVSAFPSTFFAFFGPPPVIRARVGTLNDHTMTTLPEVVTNGLGGWQLLRVFGDRQLPPTAAPFEDAWHDYAVEVQARGGNESSAEVRVDGLWIVPSREPQVEAYVQGFSNIARRRFVIESHRSGRGSLGWLEDTGTGAEAGRLTTSGTLAIAPGTSIVLLSFLIGGGDHEMAAQGTATLTIWPRVRWEAVS